MTYEYQILTTGQIIEVEQRITEPAHEVLEIDGELVSVRRLISGAPLVNLASGGVGWASGGYSKTKAQVIRDTWVKP